MDSCISYTKNEGEKGSFLAMMIVDSLHCMDSEQAPRDFLEAELHEMVFQQANCEEKKTRVRKRKKLRK